MKSVSNTETWVCTCLLKTTTQRHVYSTTFQILSRKTQQKKMANAQTEIRLIEFVINEEETTCNLFYTSSEPDNPFWGGGWKNKAFNKGVSIVDFINLEVSNFLDWDNGKKSGQFK